jgi:ABC-type uncharacterized transport system substrate-binding protein
MQTCFRIFYVGFALGVAGACSGAVAHPHVLPSVRASIVFDERGEITGVRQSWTYDHAYSAFILKTAGKSPAGSLSEGELKTFLESQVAALGKHSFFTTARSQAVTVDFAAPQDVAFVQLPDARLELSFFLPLASPGSAKREVVFEIHDPNYFAYFTIPPNGLTLQNASANCSATVVGPAPIDLRQTSLIPKAFWQALDGSATASAQFVNRITVSCL